jgi:hypothetical protein
MPDVLRLSPASQTPAVGLVYTITPALSNIGVPSRICAHKWVLANGQTYDSINPQVHPCGVWNLITKLAEMLSRASENRNKIAEILHTVKSSLLSMD